MPHLSVVIAIDLSGSMSGMPLSKAQEAATKFVNNLDLTNTSVALIGFSDRVRVNQDLIQDNKRLVKGINEWSKLMSNSTLGYGNDADPFTEAPNVLKKQEDPRFIIVLADGVWVNQKKAIERARKCANEGIEIIAIGFGGADKAFLRAIATSEENALFTNLDSLVGSFSKIAQVLTDTGGAIKKRDN